MHSDHIPSDSIAQWLASTAKSRGYVSPKAKNSNKGSKAISGRPTYTVALKEWTALAEYIVGLTDPPVAVPKKLAALLDATIVLRESYSADLSDILDDTADKRRSDDRHSFFLEVLEKVRKALASRIPSSHASTKKAKSVEEAINMFDHLELEDTSEAFNKAPDVVATPTSQNEPIYKSERQSDVEESYFALHLLLHDLDKLRTEVARAWEGYKQGVHDIVAASITTNIAVSLARSMTEELRTMFSKQGGAYRMLQVFYATQCIMSGTSEAHRARPGDDLNFAMYKVANALFMPAALLLDAFCDVLREGYHPEMKRGFYGNYNPSSNRESKGSRERFLEDKILLLEMLPEFYFYCLTTAPDSPPVEDEFTRALRTTFKAKEIELPVVFAATLFLDIHHILRDQVDYGFKRLTDATHFIVDNITEEIKFHKGIHMDTWPSQNDEALQQFTEMVEFWIHSDQQRKVAPQMKRINTPEPFQLYRKHPWSCGLWKYWAQMQFHEFSIVFVNAWGSVMSCAHLYNAVQNRSQKLTWKDMQVATGLQEPETFFIGEAPKTPDECLKRFALAMGASAATLAKSTRKKKGLTLSKRGPKGLKELGTLLQTFRSSICDAIGPKDIRAEDVQKILEKSSWSYELDEDKKAATVFRDSDVVPDKALTRQLPVDKCLGLMRDILHAEMIEVSFDYFRLHRQCWRLLRHVKEQCRDDLIRIFGPDYIQKESELPFVVGYVLLSASSSQQLVDLKSKLPSAQITSKLLEDAADTLKAMIDAGAGGLIVDVILPKALGISVEFQVEE